MSDRSDTSTEPLHFLSLLEVADRIRRGELSPVALTESILDRIAEIDADLHTYANVMTDSALASALRAESEITAGRWHGPLHGVPVAVKDLCYTRGTRTMGGLAVLSDFVPDHDAAVVSKLAAAGAVLLGKLNLTEGAMGGYNRKFAIPRNPWGENLWAGASSSGSGAATAAGLCFAALGSDTGGSIRFPAMANGVVGLKPTYGLVSRYGVLPLAESLDHVGPLARRVGDAAAVLEAIAGPDDNDPTSLPGPVFDILGDLDSGIEGARIGFDRAYATTGVDPGLVDAIETALATLQQLGANIVEIEMPAVSPELVDAWFSICAYEAGVAHAEHYPARAAEYGEYFREFLEFATTVSDADYSAASELRKRFSATFRSALASVDAVATPAGGAPFAVSDEVLYGDMSAFDPVMSNVHFQFTLPADFAGTPSLSQPCGANDDGVPYTLQLLGERLSEPTICRIGHAFEQATSWHTLAPNL